MNLLRKSGSKLTGLLGELTCLKSKPGRGLFELAAGLVLWVDILKRNNGGRAGDYISALCPVSKASLSLLSIQARNLGAIKSSV